jgi:anaerobic glycerol-3-phosphate dehydrogenase
MLRKERLYLGWRWSQASGAVAGRCSGEATRCRQTRNAQEDDRVAKNHQLASDGLFSAKQKNIQDQFKILAAPLLHGDISTTCNKPHTTARWPTTTYNDTMADNHKHTIFIFHHAWLAFLT